MIAQIPADNLDGADIAALHEFADCLPAGQLRAVIQHIADLLDEGKDVIAWASDDGGTWSDE